MITPTFRAALAELVRPNEILRARLGEPSADKRRAMTVEYDAASPAAWAAARAALSLEAVPTGMTPFTESALTALESRIRADEREKCAKEVPTTWLHPLLSGKSAAMPRADEAINGSHIEALLRGVAAAIRNSDAAPVGEG